MGPTTRLFLVTWQWLPHANMVVGPIVEPFFSRGSGSHMLTWPGPQMQLTKSVGYIDLFSKATPWGIMQEQEALHLSTGVV